MTATEPFEDRMNRAANALKRLPSVTEDVMLQITRIRSAHQPGANETKDKTIKERIFTMKRITKIAIAAVVVLGCGALFGLLATGNGGSGVVFADVVDKMNAAQSLSLDATLSRPGKPEQKYHNDISGACYRKSSSTGTIQVADGNQRKMVSLNPKDRLARIRTYNPEGNRPIDFLLNVVDELREAKTEDLGEKVLQGRTTVGFRAHKVDGAQREQQVDVWVDVETSYPVRIEMLYKNQGVTLVMHNFTWNPELDDLLFELTPPPGYTVTDETK